MKTTLNLAIALFILVASVTSCKKKDDPKPKIVDTPNETELITTMKLILTNDISGNESTFVFRDLDGPGGNVPTIDDMVLNSNTTYSGRIILLDETKTPADSISNEVQEEGAEHQFFFTIGGGASLTHQYKVDDVDANAVPIGLAPRFTAVAASTGTLTVILKHQPGVKPTSGQGSSALGETDIEVTFNVSIEGII